MIKKISDILSNKSKPVDPKKEFDDYLDAAYSLYFVGGLSQFSRPSTVLKEVSPTDYHKSQVEWMEHQDWVEVEGHYWNKSDYEDALKTLETELEDDILFDVM